MVEALGRHARRRQLHDFLAQGDGCGWCRHPIRLHGYATRGTNGDRMVVFSSASLPDGVVLKACGSRSELQCPACATVYWGDARHLVRAGLEGGKGVDESVSTHPAGFLTLTAPGFGVVHGLRTGSACHPKDRVEILLAPRPVSRARCGTAAPTVWSGHRCALNATTTSAPSCRTPARPSCGDEPPSTSNVSSPMSSGALRPTWRVRFASPTDVGDVAHERPKGSSHQNYWLRLQRHPVIASTRRNRSLRLDTGPESRNPGPSRIRAPPER